MSEIINFIFSNLFYESFTGNFVPQFGFYNIIPWFAILFFVFGLYCIFKNIRWFFCELILVIIFWLLYTFLNYRIIIGYERVIFLTSIIVVIISGFGMEEIIKYLNLRFKDADPILKYIELFVLFIFVMLIPFYTQGENWSKLVLVNYSTQKNSIPMAPANNYLTNEDLRIFKDIKEKKFLSIPWKGTVIATATKNYPIETKGGTITMNSGLYWKFINSDCSKKNQIAKEKNLDYIYSTPFSCPFFKEIDKSAEGLVLYKSVDK